MSTCVVVLVVAAGGVEYAPGGVEDCGLAATALEQPPHDVLAPMLDGLGERGVALAVGRREVEAELLPEQAAHLVRLRLRLRLRLGVGVGVGVGLRVRV